MDIENLSKTELIMAALLISFVTALLTGIVMVFLSEDAPDDIIRVTEKITSSEEAATNTDSTTTDEAGEDSEDDESDSNATTSRDAILDSAVQAVARITGSDFAPQAGILLESNFPIIIGPERESDDSPQALFENGVVADLALESQPDSEFSVYGLREASGGLSPLSVSNEALESGQEAFAVPLRNQPEIVRVTVTSVTEEGVQTSMSQPPAVTPLFNEAGLVVALYNQETERFTRIGQIID